MDMIPPTSPPALTQGVQQQAIDTLQRLVSLQDWLGDQQALQPLPHDQMHENGTAAFLAKLDAFWQAPIEPSPGNALLPRVDVLAQRLVSLMRDEALLRTFDDTLNARERMLVDALTRTNDGHRPEYLEIRELTLADVAYAGAIIVTDVRSHDLAMLFTPNRGWESFSSLDALHRRTEQGFRHALSAHTTPPGIRWSDAEQAVVRQDFVGSRVIDGDVFARLAHRIVDVQRQQVEDAWNNEGYPRQMQHRADRVRSALDLHARIDIHAMLGHREARLRTSANQHRLASVPIGLREAWHYAADAFRHEAVNAATARSQGHDLKPESLATFARHALGERLNSLGITRPVDDIHVQMRPIPTPADSHPASRRTRLIDFALHNVGWLERHDLRAVTDDGSSFQPAPSASALTSMVRELNLAERYRTYLLGCLRDDDNGRFVRNVETRLRQARMRFEATDARLSYYLPDEPIQFQPDRSERGYEWVNAIVDSSRPQGRRRVLGHDIVARQFVYEGTPLSDVLMISVRDPRSVPSVVLYTPNAPDGKTFREFTDRSELARAFLYDPTFESYLLDRLPADMADGLGHFKVSEASRRARWSLSYSGGENFTLTETPFTDKVVDGDVFEVLYDTDIYRMARDVSFLGRTTSEADWEATARLLHVVDESVNRPNRTVTELAASPARALHATWRFYDNAKAMDGTQAFLDITEAYTSALNLLPFASLGKALTPSTVLRSHTGQGLLAGRPLPNPRTRFDARFASRDVDLGGRRPDDRGLYRVQGRDFIHQDGRTYEVRAADGDSRWRLARPGALDARFSGPLVERSSTGAWSFSRHAGLRGGRRLSPEPPHDRTPTPAPPGDAPRWRVLQTDIEDLTAYQTEVLDQALRERLTVGEANAMRTGSMVNEEGVHVDQRHWQAWLASVDVARAAPPFRPQGGGLAPTGARLLPPSEWPSTVWHYMDSEWGSALGEPAVYLPVGRQPGAGILGVATTTEPPATWATRHPRPPGIREWVRIDLASMRGQNNPHGEPELRVMLDRQTGQYVLHPNTPGPQIMMRLRQGTFEAGELPPL